MIESFTKAIRSTILIHSETKQETACMSELNHSLNNNDSIRNATAVVHCCFDLMWTGFVGGVKYTTRSIVSKM